MKYITYLLAGISLILSTLVHAQLPEQPHLIVQAEASESVLPDQVTLDVTIENVSPLLQKARKNVEQRSKQLLKEIRRYNLFEEDIDAGQIQIRPEYRWNNNQQVQVGTRVSRNMRFVMRDLRRYPDLLDAITSVRINSLAKVTFGYSNAEQLKEQVLDQAILNAKNKGQRMARQLGQRISRVYSVEEISPVVPVQRGMASSAAISNGNRTSTSDYQPGEINFRSEVRVVFYLQ